MIPREDYIFTNTPANVRIAGGKVADAMAYTSEHLLFTNEAVRTMEFFGAASPDPYGVTLGGSRVKDTISPMGALGYRTLGSYVSRVEADRGISCTNFATADDGVWLYGTDGVKAYRPGMTSAAYNSRILKFSAQSPVRPDAMATPRTAAVDFLTTYGRGVIKFDARPPYIVHHLSSGGDLGRFDEFFLARNGGWTCNGSPSSSPESASGMALRPFYTQVTTLGFSASTYYREVSDKGDFAFSYEADYGYDFPAVPWTPKGRSLTEVLFCPVIGLMGCAVWKSSQLGVYAYDKTRHHVFVGGQDAMYLLAQGNGGTTWGIVSSSDWRSVRGVIDRVVAHAKASDVGFDPATFPTEPDTGSPQSFLPVGYQLYAWPEIVGARVTLADRDMGETLT